MFMKCGKTSYKGIFSNQVDTFYCSLQLPFYPDFRNATLIPSFNLKKYIDKMPDFEIFLQNLNNVEELEKLLLSSLTTPNITQYENRLSTFYNQLFQDLDEIGVSATLGRNLTCVTMNVMDPSGRNHSAKAFLPDKYPEVPVQIQEHDLPLSNVTSLSDNPNFEGVISLVQFFKQFKKLIEIFQPFWNAMEILDESCKILEPLHTVFSDCHRRIKLTESCSALLIFNSYAPHLRPSIEFRGVEEDVAKFRLALERNLINDMWDPEVDVHLNLLTLFELDSFPMNQSNENEFALIQPGECGICFEDRLEGQTANQRCENARCQSQYHQVCLLKYLCSNAASVRMRNAVLGQCPTCRESIGCSTLEWTQFE